MAFETWLVRQHFTKDNQPIFPVYATLLLMGVSAGISSYKGFEYQFHVSAWLALLAYQDEHFSALRIETTFGDDADLSYGPKTGINENTLSVTQFYEEAIVRIQIKSRDSSSTWQPSDIREMLLKTDESSTDSIPTTVAERLSTSLKERFVFITDGKVHIDFASLCVSDFISVHKSRTINDPGAVHARIVKSAKEKSIKERIDKSLTINALDRFFILETFTLYDVKLRIEHLLTHTYGLPVSAVDVTTRRLVELIRNCAARMNDQDSVTHDDLYSLVGSSQNELPFEALTQVFCEPVEYKNALTMLEHNHILVLTGEPAVGKSTIAQQLANEYSTRKYRFQEAAGEVTHLEVSRACYDLRDTFFILDDAFGINELDAVSGRTLANQFDYMITRLREAKGRVKVVITSRSNVWLEIITQKYISQRTAVSHEVKIPVPGITFKNSVLVAHLNAHTNIAASLSTYVLSRLEVFEDLQHIRDFALSLSEQTPQSEFEIDQLVDSTRPSLYFKWVRAQPSDVQLMLVTVWVQLITFRKATQADSYRVYKLLADAFNLPPIHGLTTLFDAVLDDLFRTQRLIHRDSKIDFAHPLLREAVQHFVELNPNVRKFLRLLVETLNRSIHPYDKSIALTLVVLYMKETGATHRTLARLLQKAHHLLLIETFINLSQRLLAYKDKAIRNLASDLLFRYQYDPTDYTLGKDQQLVLRKSRTRSFTSSSELARRLIWFIKFNNTTNQKLNRLFRSCLEDVTGIEFLNPFDRYKFAAWLTQGKSNANDDAVLSALRILAADPVSFVRQRVSMGLGMSGWLERPGFKEIFLSLCYDNSPIVKIAALEHGILVIWDNLPNEQQNKYLHLVGDMLVDSTFRRRARGLIGQSGTWWDYHKDNQERIRRWFEGIAERLLEYGFEFRDDLERFLSTYGDHFSNIEQPKRLRILQSLDGYLKKRPNETGDATWFIKEAVTARQTSTDEQLILLQIISRLGTASKAYLEFQFAQNYEGLPSKEFKDVVHRPFYIETENDFLYERAATLLGLISRSNSTYDVLPEPIKESGSDTESAIENYIDKQSDVFKALMIFMTLGYEKAEYAYAQSESLFISSPIQKLVNKFIVEEPTNPLSPFIADAILSNGYRRIGEREYRKLNKLILYNPCESLAIAGCNSWFEANTRHHIHNVRDWVINLLRLLRHPNDIVRQHAFNLFNRFFDDIWSDLVYENTGNFGRKAIRPLICEPMLSYLSTNSEPMRELIDLRVFCSRAEQNWVDFSSVQQQKYIDGLCSMVNPHKHLINEAIFHFYNSVEEHLTPEQNQQLAQALHVQRDSQGVVRRHMSSKEALFHKDDYWDDLFPKLDWSQFIDSSQLY